MISRVAPNGGQHAEKRENGTNWSVSENGKLVSMRNKYSSIISAGFSRNSIEIEFLITYRFTFIASYLKFNVEFEIFHAPR